jgi:large subunit ribosomal protein L13
VDTLSYKTVSANKATVQKDWLLVDAENETVGRLASKVAYLVRGKHKTSYTPHVDCGDNVVIINAEKVRFSGNKLNDKVYTRYTGYPGGQRFVTPKELMASKPERILELAIGRMLPKTRLGERLKRNVFIYAGEAHLQEAQSPKKIDLKTIKERK